MKTHLIRLAPMSNHLTICGIDIRTHDIQTAFSVKSTTCTRCNGQAAHRAQLKRAAADIWDLDISF